ncbi:hypothetical protein FOZ60_015190 [Perkinsus olseni]|uniref:Uncharacterized protein n=1 Tax=Perkinsus olseni TaxID=32597 RepID=A0A7J6P798_PEROL|nr:hypothetical protein FOZ60_015190 [Perkinsus olseni]
MGCTTSRHDALDEPLGNDKNKKRNPTAATTTTAAAAFSMRHLPRNVNAPESAQNSKTKGRHTLEMLTEDELIHKGIACAQAASVTKDATRRLERLEEAKLMLMEALSRQQARNDVSSPGFCPTPATTAANSPDGYCGNDATGQRSGAEEREGRGIEVVGSRVSYEPKEAPQRSPPLPSCAPDVLLKYQSLMQTCSSPAAFSPVVSLMGSDADSLQIMVDCRHRSISRHGDRDFYGHGAYDDEDGVMDESASVLDFDPDNDEPLSDEKCDEVLSEIVSQAGSSMGHSPASSAGSEWNISDFNPLLVENRSKSLVVFMHSGITGELVSKFEITLADKKSIEQLYTALEISLQRECGLGLAETHWVHDNRRIRCDKRMLLSALAPAGHCELRMCTVPKTPPAEMDIYASRNSEGIRLKSLAPHTLSPDRTATLYSSVLGTFEGSYSGGRGFEPRGGLAKSPANLAHVAMSAAPRPRLLSSVLVSQMDSGNSCWLSGKALFIEHAEGVIQFALTEAQVKSLLRRTQDGLFDVYLVVDGSLRSENRRTVVVIENSGVVPGSRAGDDGDTDSSSCDSSDVASWAEFDPIL